MRSVWKDNIVPGLALFTSLGTLLCCALPALLVTLGMGATMAGILSAAPWLTALSAHKDVVFTGAGLLIADAAFLQWRARNAPCPADPKMARICLRARRVSWVVLGLSAALYLIGGFFAFFAADLLL